MSFNFKWPTFSKEFHESAAQMLDSALNRGPKPKVIADDIRVEELCMGTIPPELEILEIGDLGTDRFRGIFRLTYAGDAHLVLKTKVQANPLAKPNRPDIGLFPSSTASRGILFAAAPLIVPMHLRLSEVKLRAIVVLVVSKAKGITLVFKNDPLESVQVSSTFDSVAVIQKYLQQEIEAQLREMFREDLPGIIHRLSQRWLSGQANQEKETSQPKPRTEQPLQQQTRETPLPRSTSDPYYHLETASMPAGIPRSKSRTRPGVAASVAAGPSASKKTPPSSPPQVRGSHMRRAKHVSKAASTSAAPLHNELLSSSPSFGGSIFPDMESYDPTYGLRPDDLPMQSGFSGLGNLARRVSAGLKDLTAPSSEEMNYNFAQQEQTAGPSSTKIPPFTSSSPDSFDQLLFDSSADLDFQDDLNQEHHDDLSADDDQGSSQEIDDHIDDSTDDVSDLEVDHLADASFDYSRFGYPPASAAFSDTQEANRTSSIIFDDEPVRPSRKGRTSTGSSKSVTNASVASAPRSVRSSNSMTRRRPKSRIEYETIPAVGGGTVTRPRVYHIASKVQPPEVDWDDQSTARPSQFGGAGSSRTGGTTRFGSEFGSTTMGEQSSHANTIRGFISPPLVPQSHLDGSQESLVELPPESMHSSDRSRGRGAAMVAVASSRASSSSTSLDHNSALNSSGFLSKGISSRAMSWDLSASSTAPTSALSTALGSGPDMVKLPYGSDASAIPRNSQQTSGDDGGSTGGIRFRRNKSTSASHARSMTSGHIDRSSFVQQPYGQGSGAAATPTRSRPSYTSTSPQPGLVASPSHSTMTNQSQGFGISPSQAEFGSSSPLSAQDLLSTSPFRNLSLHQGSPRNIHGSYHGNFAGSTGGAGSGQANATTLLSIDASAHFIDLVKSNHTLSPFTRNLEHFTVRSAPVTPGWQTSASASVVGSSTASGTGSGGSQHGASAHVASGGGANGMAKPGPTWNGNNHGNHPSMSTSTAPDGHNTPTRPKRTFQLGGDNNHSKSNSNSTSSHTASSSLATPHPVGHRQDGFARFAGKEPRAFGPPSLSVSATASSKQARRRSRPDIMAPPSEAARINASRWEAIRE